MVGMAGRGKELTSQLSFLKAVCNKYKKNDKTLLHNSYITETMTWDAINILIRLTGCAVLFM